MDRTMTVGELKKKLEEYPEDTPVFFTWEGTHNTCQSEGFEMKPLKFAADGKLCLVIDAEDYGR